MGWNAETCLRAKAFSFICHVSLNLRLSQYFPEQYGGREERFTQNWKVKQACRPCLQGSGDLFPSNARVGEETGDRKNPEVRPVSHVCGLRHTPVLCAVGHLEEIRISCALTAEGGSAEGPGTRWQKNPVTPKTECLAGQMDGG